MRLQWAQAHQHLTDEDEDGKTLPGLMCHNFCCDMQMVGSEFGMKNRNPSISCRHLQYIYLACTVTRSQLNKAPLGCGGTGDSQHECKAEKSAAIA